MDSSKSNKSSKSSSSKNSQSNSNKSGSKSPSSKDKGSMSSKSAAPQPTSLTSGTKRSKSNKSSIQSSAKSKAASGTVKSSSPSRSGVSKSSKSQVPQSGKTKLKSVKKSKKSRSSSGKSQSSSPSRSRSPKSGTKSSKTQPSSSGSSGKKTKVVNESEKMKLKSVKKSKKSRSRSGSRSLSPKSGSRSLQPKSQFKSAKSPSKKTVSMPDAKSSRSAKLLIGEWEEKIKSESMAPKQSTPIKPITSGTFSVGQGKTQTECLDKRQPQRRKSVSLLPMTLVINLKEVKGSNAPVSKSPRKELKKIGKLHSLWEEKVKAESMASKRPETSGSFKDFETKYKAPLAAPLKSKNDAFKVTIIQPKASSYPEFIPPPPADWLTGPLPPPPASWLIPKDANPKTAVCVSTLEMLHSCPPEGLSDLPPPPPSSSPFFPSKFTAFASSSSLLVDYDPKWVPPPTFTPEPGIPQSPSTESSDRSYYKWPPTPPSAYTPISQVPGPSDNFGRQHQAFHDWLDRFLKQREEAILDAHRNPSKDAGLGAKHKTFQSSSASTSSKSSDSDFKGGVGRIQIQVKLQEKGDGKSTPSKDSNQPNSENSKDLSSSQPSSKSSGLWIRPPTRGSNSPPLPPMNQPPSPSDESL